MTEYEMAYLHAEITNSTILIFTGFFTVLTAFLFVSYMVAHKLTRTMMVICVGLYLFLCTGTLVLNVRTLSNLAGLSLKMRTFAQGGNGLDWHWTASSPEWNMLAAPYVGAFLYSVAIVSSVYFFFHCRRVNRKAEAAAWKPKA